MTRKQCRDAGIDITWVNPRDKRFIQLSSGDFVNLTMATRLQVGEGFVRLHWMGGDSASYTGDDALVLQTAWKENCGLLFNKGETEYEPMTAEFIPRTDSKNPSLADKQPEEINNE